MTFFSPSYILFINNKDLWVLVSSYLQGLQKYSFESCQIVLEQ